MAFDLVSYLMGRAAGGGSGKPASGISYDNSTSGLNSTNVQGAIDELAESRVKGGSVTLSLSWSGTAPYTQEVTVTGATVTENSEVSLRPTAAQVSSLIADGVTAIVIENNNGTLTAYALGKAPSAAMTFACEVMEVVA